MPTQDADQEIAYTFPRRDCETGTRTRSPFWWMCAVVFKTRGIMMVPPVAALGLLHSEEWTSTLVAWMIGLPLFLAGWALRIWSQRHLRYRLRKESGLATTGPYAHMRNPVYVGNALILVGLCVLCRLVWAVPVICVWAAIIYGLSIRFEESRLRQRYGETFAAYCRAVPRWWPRRFSPISDEFARVASWPRVFAAEWQCPLLLAMPLAKELIGR